MTNLATVSKKTEALDIRVVRKIAEAYYRNGEFYCSEAIVKTIRDLLRPDLPESIIRLASGFPVGTGAAGCQCGAIAGGVMAIGIIFGREKAGDPAVNKAMALSKELHDFFVEKHGSTCCRVLTKGKTLGSSEHMKQCVSLTGDVAEYVALIINREYVSETSFHANVKFD